MSVRVYQLAKQLGLDNKHVIRLLQERGLDVSGPSNTIPSIYADALIEEIGGEKLIFQEPSKIISSDATDIPPTSQDQSESTNEISDQVIANEIVTPKVVQQSDISSGFTTTDIPSMPTVVENSEIKPVIAIQKQNKSFVSIPNRQNRNSQRITKLPSKIQEETGLQKKDFIPDVQLPELPKQKPTESIRDESTPSVASKFKPFLKKIERQSSKLSELKNLEIKPPLIIRSLAIQMDVKPFQLISKLMGMGIFASMNQEIELAVAKDVAEKFGYNLELAKSEPEKPFIVKPSSKKIHTAVAKSKNLVERPPVVCVLGHVDHGKTTLLDTIRQTRVAAGEPGGITQHVAAYQVETKSGKKITFIDTPGHAAFSKIRERGANMTDIAILVVAADDGFMPQTDEALKFIKKAGIPIVVAINKMDAKGANIDRVKQQMQQRGITSEDWGGGTLCAQISALKNINIDQLLDLVTLQAEMMELRCDIDGHPEGIILESRIFSGHGATAGAIVQDGTLHVGDCVICGQCYCKVKSLINDKGQQIKQAPASTPVNIVGWSAIPDVGRKFTFVENEKLARLQAEENQADAKLKHDKIESRREIRNVDQLFSAIASVEEKTLNVILRSDVHGSAEALKDFLSTIKSTKIKLNILDSGIGVVSKNDIIAANTSNAQIVAFNVKVETNAQALAKQLKVQIINHNIIYELAEQVREAMAEQLEPELQEHKLGAAEVRQIFNIKNDIVAGCMVTEGKIIRDKFVRVIRKKEIIFQGKFSSIRKQKEDIQEVRAGFECGIVISGFHAIVVGDIIECFEIKKIQPSL